MTPIESLGNQILGYLFGFTPKLEVVDGQDEVKEHEEAQKKFEEEVQKSPKVNSHDAKLHFLMGRYDS